VQEALLRGLNHALSNRLASLGAIAMLLEGEDLPDARMLAALTGDVGRLEELLGLFRALPAAGDPRRTAVRVRDGLARAAALMEHHPVCRDVSVTVGDEPPDAEPVRLLTPDPLRASVCLLAAVACGAGAETMTAAVRAVSGRVDLCVSRVGGSPDEVRATAEFAALERFAAAEAALLRATATADGVELALSLPGLSLSRVARS
jgi:hypothetical protein